MNKTWELEGIIFLDQPKTSVFTGMQLQNFFVRYTSDEIGKSLSIADEKAGVMFQIPFDSIYEFLKLQGDAE